MGNAINMRATSIGASAVLVGAALIAALTATISVKSHLSEGAPTIFSVPFVRDEPTPPQPQPHATRPQRPDLEATETILPTPSNLPSKLDLVAPLDPGPITGPVEITNPFWARRPANLDRFYPARAAGRGVEGRAELDCLVAITGALSCSVVSESPGGWGFGDAALRIAREYSMQPAMRNGTPVSGHYRMNVPFTLR